MVKEIIKKCHIQSIIENLGLVTQADLTTSEALALTFALRKLKEILNALPI